MGRVFISFLFVMTMKSAWAGSCCGQSPSQFRVLNSGQSFSLQLGYTSLTTVGRIFEDSSAFFIWEDRSRSMQFLTLDLAWSLGVRHQLFVRSAKVLTEFENSSGLGREQSLADTQLGYTYELLPEYVFSWWRPKVYISTLINTPTGQSIYDPSLLSEGAGVTGHNQWGGGLGLSVYKTWYPFSLMLQSRTFLLKSREFAEVEVSSFLDHATSLVASYSLFDSWVLNAGLSWNALGPRRIRPQARQNMSAASPGGEFYSVLVAMQKSLSDSWIASLSYTDQTLVGPARNTLLNRSFTFNLTYNHF